MVNINNKVVSYRPTIHSNSVILKKTCSVDLSLAAKLIDHQVNAQPCDRNQQSEQIIFTEKKDTERNRHGKEVFTNFSNDSSK